MTTGEQAGRALPANDVTTMLGLAGKVALVTGGGRNFGEEITTGLAEAGARVIITARELDRAQRAADRLNERFPGRITGMAMDLNCEDDIVKLFAAVRAEFGALDILVNNAGGHSPEACGFLERETLAGWEAFIRPNLTGTFLMTREYARLMMPHRRGCIVNIASISSLLGRDRSVYPAGMTPNPIAYTAAKAGLIGLTYDSAAYLGPHGIRVNAISPGGFERGQPESFIRAYADRTMLGRMGRQGHDLKGAVVFLASEAASYITGHNLYVDAGFSRYK